MRDRALSSSDWKEITGRFDVIEEKVDALKKQDSEPPQVRWLAHRIGMLIVGAAREGLRELVKKAVSYLVVGMIFGGAVWLYRDCQARMTTWPAEAPTRPDSPRSLEAGTK